LSIARLAFERRAQPRSSNDSIAIKERKNPISRGLDPEEMDVDREYRQGKQRCPPPSARGDDIAFD